MKGDQIADLIIAWANKQGMHPDDFGDFFVDELMEMLDKDKGENS